MGSFHARSLTEIPGVDVAVLADPFGDGAPTMAHELGTAFTREPDLVVADSTLDGVVIASPDQTHAALALRALDAGQMVLCEKPLATSLADCQQVVAAEVGHSTRRIQLGFMREYDQAHVQVATAIAGLGRIHHIRSVHRNTNEQTRPLTSVLGQSVVHDLHTIRWLSGSEVATVSGFATLRPGGYQHVSVVCELADGSYATVEFDDNTFAYEVEVDVSCEGGRVTSGPPTRATVGTSGHASQHVGDDWFGRFADAYRIELRHWIGSVRSQAAIGPSAWDGLAAQAIVEAALTSIESGTKVDVSLPSMPDLYKER